MGQRPMSSSVRGKMLLCGLMISSQQKLSDEFNMTFQVVSNELFCWHTWPDWAPGFSSNRPW